MNKKTIITLGLGLVIVICFATLVGWGVYQILNIPSIKEGFKSTGDEFGAMFELQQKVIRRYACQDVGVELMNGNTLNVSLINSELNNLPSSKQSASAHEIALFVQDNYSGKAKITRIVINFVENHNLGPINTSSLHSYPFDILELQQNKETGNTIFVMFHDDILI